MTHTRHRHTTQATVVMLLAAAEQEIIRRYYRATVDEGIFRSLGMQVTSEPVFQKEGLYRKR